MIDKISKRIQNITSGYCIYIKDQKDKTNKKNR